MKCIYTEAEVTMSGAQLLACAINEDGQPIGKSERKFIKIFPEAYGVVKKMMMSDAADPPRLGDVIWATQGGNKHIGFCIVRKGGDEEKLHSLAVKACMKSIGNKAKELNHKYVGMDLFGSDNSSEWNDVVEDIEETLTDTQPVICIDTNEKLVDVLSHLPGGSNFKAWQTTGE